MAKRYTLERGTVDLTFSALRDQRRAGFRVTVPCWYTTVLDGLRVAIHHPYTYDDSTAVMKMVEGGRKKWAVTEPRTGLTVHSDYTKTRSQAREYVELRLMAFDTEKISRSLLKGMAESAHLTILDASQVGSHGIVIPHDALKPLEV